jgi:hypothetical protein
MAHFITTVLLSTTLVLTPVAASAAKNQQLNASRSQVEAACDANGGFAWGTGASSGRYGCMTDGAWVECDEQGDCEGGQAIRKPSAAPLGAPAGAMQF